MEIRYFENQLDVQTYFDLRTSVDWINFSPEQTQTALKNSVLDIVAYDQEKAVGMGRIVGDGAIYCYVQDVVIHPNYQGKGIGSTILNKLIEKVAQNLEDGERMSLGLVAAEGKESFYRQFGFKDLPHEASGAGMRKVIYKK